MHCHREPTVRRVGAAALVLRFLAACAIVGVAAIVSNVTPLPVYIDIIIFLGLVVLGFMASRAVRRWRHAYDESPVARCRRCGYDLTGSPLPRCPECGALIGFEKSAEEMGIEDDELRFER